MGFLAFGLLLSMSLYILHCNMSIVIDICCLTVYYICSKTLYDKILFGVVVLAMLYRIIGIGQTKADVWLVALRAYVGPRYICVGLSALLVDKLLSGFGGIRSYLVGNVDFVGKEVAVTDPYLLAALGGGVVS